MRVPLSLTSPNLPCIRIVKERAGLVVVFVLFVPSLFFFFFFAFLPLPFSLSLAALPAPLGRRYHGLQLE